MITSMGSLTLTRTDSAHLGTSSLTSMMSSVNKKQNEKTEKPKGAFEQYFLDAVNSVNDKQIASDTIAQQLITDPDSVDVHDVTIAMAKASLSLSLAQTVVDRVIKDWNEITTNR